MGRPTIITPKLKEKALLYIKECEDKEEEFHKTRGSSSDSFERVIRVKLPSIEGLATYLDVSRSTLYLWRDSDKDFSDIFEKLLEKQAESLINNGLGGTYNPTIAKVLLTKHGYRDSSELTGKDGEKLIPETITEEEKTALRNLVLIKDDIEKSTG